ncbi:GAF domain-containing protein [Planomonospora sp. ID67723]|uniref:ATP-binding protein n=1 Tax=Planomonospora sp. ID67723 TaxID=2738134 RepID=UPI0018C40AA0|nr:ATP-binding protein [Planomonospora sp. ID67723]MBG0831079.1 GAF domain-containing protein [Planomonospora sp. ID67723]
MVTTDHVRDAGRVARAIGLLDADEVPLLDRVTALARRLLGVPVARVSLVDRGRQVVVSQSGPGGRERTGGSPLARSMCRHVVDTAAPLVVEDARADGRWGEADAASGRKPTAYAGVPVRTGTGQVLGVLCVIDAGPRPWDREQLSTLEDLASMVEAEIALRLTRADDQAMRDRVPEAFFSLDGAGAVTGWNAAAERLLGWSAEEAVGRSVAELAGPRQSRRDWERDLRRVLREAGEEQTARRLELLAADRSGREFPAELLVQVSSGPEGAACHAVLRDIGRRQEAEREMQHRLEREKTFLAALIDSLDVGIAACDDEGQMTFNRELRHGPFHVSSLHVKDVLKEYRLFAPDGRTPLALDQMPIMRALAGEHVTGEHVVVHLPEAGFFRLLVNARPIDTSDGHRLGAVATTQDITRQHRNEVLRTAQQSVVEALAEAGSAEEAAEGVISAVTGALGWCCGEYWQVDPGQETITLVGSWSAPDREPQICVEGPPTTLGRGQGLPGTVWADGRELWICDPSSDRSDFFRIRQARRAGLRTAVALPVRSGGEVLGVLVFFTDVLQQEDDELVALLDGVCAHVGRHMERRRAEELSSALESNRRRLERIVAQLNDDVWSIEADPDGSSRVLQVNSNIARLLGGPLPEGVDVGDFVMRRIHPDDLRRVSDFRSAVLGGERAEVEYRLIGVDGVTRWIWTRGMSREEGGRLLVDGVSTDVSERHRLADEREHLLAQERRQVRRLRELDRMKDELMALVTHELRNPISSICGYTEMLLDDPDLTDTQQTFASAIDRKSAHLQRLVDDLLDLARLDAGYVAIDLRPVHLNRLLRQAVDDHRPAARAKEITVTADVPDRLPVRADPLRLRQVLDNLLSNAIKYTPEGGAVAVTAARDDSGEVTFTVADTGIGIPAEQYDQLFCRFFRASTAKEAGIKGTGLGLAITRSIVTAHGGTVTAHPREGGGTVFTVRLPPDPPDPPDPDPPDPDPPGPP